LRTRLSAARLLCRIPAARNRHPNNSQPIGRCPVSQAAGAKNPRRYLICWDPPGSSNQGSRLRSSPITAVQSTVSLLAPSLVLLFCAPIINPQYYPTVSPPESTVPRRSRSYFLLLLLPFLQSIRLDDIAPARPSDSLTSVACRTIGTSLLQPSASRASRTSQSLCDHATVATEARRSTCLTRLEI
jgi:hypothetical protein